MSLWEVLVSIFWFMLLVAWFWVLIAIVTDIFRDSDSSGFAKAGWCLFVLVLPWLGVLTYLLVRGPSMGDRRVRELQRQQDYFRQQTQPTVADEIGRLADLHDRGKITAEDYELAKRKVLGTTPDQPTVATT